MDPIEEQAQEIEVLESIYPDELMRISDKRFVITILLETDTERKHRLALDVEYPEQYPEVVPELHVRVAETPEDEVSEEEEDEEDKDDDEEHHTPVQIPETVFFDHDDLEELHAELVIEAEENVGMPSVFTLVSTLKDKAETMFIRKCEQAQKEHDDELLRREEEEQKKFNGTKVTPEVFLAWRERFKKELKIDERLEERARIVHGGKLTGKELFEKGLAGDDLSQAVGALQV